ncbi:hypothetical protein D3C81_1184610 [compost metagenome]
MGIGSTLCCWHPNIVNAQKNKTVQNCNLIIPNASLSINSNIVIKYQIAVNATLFLQDIVIKRNIQK